MPRLLGTLWPLAIIGLGTASAVEREVEFRDGSRLVLDIEPFEFTLKPVDGKATGEPMGVPFANVGSVAFSEVPAFDRVRRITGFLRQLRSDDFREREQAAQGLSRLASGFRKLLEEDLAAAFDPEIRWRLHRILENLPTSTVDEYDHLRVGRRALKGELARWSATALFHGESLRLDRETVRAIRVLPRAPEAGGKRFEAINDTEAADLPAAVQRITFERAPDGKPLRTGDDLGRRFTDWGVQLSTSVEDSYVAINQYDIDGASGGFAAATHEPLYEGSITIRFCRPGEAKIPAGVSFVGCWVGIVEPKSVALVAYDAADNELGRAVVKDGPYEFLGIRSSSPIAYATLVPDEEIDPNYTIDDITYAPPAPLSDTPHPEHFAFILRDGSRLHCRQFSKVERGGDGDSLSLQPASPFVDKLSVPMRDVVTIIAPGAPPDDIGGENQLWGMLADGSKRAIDPASEGGLERLPLRALWNSRRPLRPIPDGLEIPEGQAALFLRRDPIMLRKVMITEDSLTGQRENGASIEFDFGRLPTVWFGAAPPERPAEGQGQIDLYTGERYRFGRDAQYRLLSLGEPGGAVHIRPTGSATAESMELDYRKVFRIHLP